MHMYGLADPAPRAVEAEYELDLALTGPPVCCVTH